MSNEVMAAIDLGDEAHHASILSKAWQMAQLDEASLAVVTVVPDFGMSSVGAFFPPGTAKRAMEGASEALHKIVRNILPDVAPDKVVHIVRRGKAYHEILETAKARKPTLIVIGAHRTMLSDYLLGTNAARVLRHVNCSVLVLRESQSAKDA
ncbi:universal stress protein [Thioclava sp.]|uniref:universal stress protein n=1 Tax=Thioclava sp. TaxID=1933450 RepID=UPI003AA83010